ncbi:hypothetical protein GOP47_0019679 [Adiantum capillus-veneris]|uniref:Uncharacterized protein n=1 Tax=Adiantum capillus-veneris TaxID=13818 RepID=A0A9D4UBH7_ADICA|nr:hypothetical protein GOP47_0019679 [Adiantum capillus-veneris]
MLEKSSQEIMEIIFSLKFEHVWHTMPGIGFFGDAILAGFYAGLKYNVHLSLHRSGESVRMDFGQISSTIVNYASLEEACKNAGQVLVEAISE